MLETLDQTDWAATRYAFGPATRVPELLRGLVAEKKRARAEAYELLADAHLVHQGTPYPAAIVALPFLLELLESDGAHDKENILDLVLRIAVGTPEAIELAPAAASVLDALAADEGVRGAAYRAVNDVVGRIVPLVAAAVKVRCAALRTLAFSRESSKHAASIRATVAKFKDERTRLCAMLFAGYVARFSRVIVDPSWVPTDAPGVRASATIARAMGGDVEDEALAEIARTEWPDTVSSPFPPLAVLAFKVRLWSAPPERAAAIMMEELRSASPERALVSTEELLRAVLASVDVGLRAERLTAAQREAITLAMARTGGSSFFCSRETARALGIPRAVDDASRWLGIEPPGPLESVVVAGACAAALLLDYARGRLSRESALSSLRTVPVSDLIAVARATLRGAYGLDEEDAFWFVNGVLFFVAALVDRNAAPALRAMLLAPGALGYMSLVSLLVIARDEGRLDSALSSRVAEAISDFSRASAAEVLREIVSATTDRESVLRDAELPATVDTVNVVDEREAGPRLRGWAVVDLGLPEEATARVVQALGEWTNESPRGERHPVDEVVTVIERIGPPCVTAVLRADLPPAAQRVQNALRSHLAAKPS